MTVTRRDFEALARVIRDIDLSLYGDQQDQQRRYIASAFASALVTSNPRFSRERFIAAALGEAVTYPPLDAFPALTDDQQETFEAITSGEYDNLALMSAHLDGQPVGVICAITEDGEMYDIHPLAVLVTDALFPRLTPPIPSEGAAA